MVLASANSIFQMEDEDIKYRNREEFELKWRRRKVENISIWEKFEKWEGGNE